MNWSAILPFALPPLLGAVIGYVTNSIAVRMLFRPLRAWRIGPLRIPFTPGVIPRRREQLALSIGRMVSKELLTSEVFEKRFADARFAHSLRRGLVALLDRVSATRLATATETLNVAALLDEALAALERLWAGGGGSGGAIQQLLDSLVVDHRDALVTVLSDLAVQTRPLKHVDRVMIDRAIFGIAPIASDALEDFLNRTEVRSDIETRARRIIRFTLDQLSDVQRLFVGVGQYDRRLMQRVPEIVERSISELLATVRAPDRLLQAAGFAFDWVETNRDRRLDAFVSAQTLRPIFERALAGPTPVSTFFAGKLQFGGGDVVKSLAVEARARWESYAAQNADTLLGDLVPALRRRRATIARRLAPTIQRLLSAVAVPFVAQLDVEGVVVDRVNQLDIERVEGLLLGIIRDHLRWINVFGALLGAIIGASQILLRLVGL